MLQNRLIPNGQLFDLMTTCVDLAGATYPKDRKGVAVTPMQGTSLVPALQGEKLKRKQPLFWEHEGNRGIRDGKWKLVAKGAQSPWELYNIDADRSELYNLAAENTDLVSRLAGQWQAWAERSNVFPWPWGDPPRAEDVKPGVKFDLNCVTRRPNARRAVLQDVSENKIGFQVIGTLTPSAEGTVFDGKSWIEMKKNGVLNCAFSPWKLEVALSDHADDGVIFSHGGTQHGYALFLESGKLGFAVRIEGKLFVVTAPEPLKSVAEISAEITTEKTIVLFVDGKKAAETEIPDYVQQYPADPPIIGNDEAGTVSGRELPPFRGTMRRLVIIRGDLPKN